MFAMIDVSKATHLAIYMPADKASTALPALAKMLENNTRFIAKSYSEVALVEQGKMEILLGDKLVVDSDYGDGNKLALIEPGSDVLDGWTPVASPEVFADFRKTKEKHAEEKKKMQTEIDYLKSKISELTAAAAESANTSDAYEF